jgi:hypothetical protein
MLRLETVQKQSPRLRRNSNILRPWLPAGAKVGRSRKRHRRGRERTLARQRLECVELAPALARPSQPESASKLDALHTLRESGRRRPTPSLQQPALAGKKIGSYFCTSPKVAARQKAKPISENFVGFWGRRLFNR